MPRVSVCLPVYNGAKYIAEAIKSVLDQSYEDFELLIADDRSCDGSWEIIDSFSKQDKRVKAWHNEINLGHYGNYNACIAKASGEYIKLFAQDDLLHSQFIERFVSVMDQYPNVSLINCARRWIDSEGKSISANSKLDIRLTRPFDKNTQITGEDAIVSTLKESINWLGEPSSQMFRAKFVDGSFDTTYRQIGDIEYNYRLLEHGDYYFINEELCNFRKHSDSWTTANSRELSTYLEWLLLASKHRKYLKQANLTPEQYCLNFIKDWTRNLEEKMYQDNRLGKNERETLLRELCGNIDPLEPFSYEKHAQRDLLSEYKILAALGLLQGALLENELRLANEAAAEPYTEITAANSVLSEKRPGMVAALHGLKETLQERDKEIELLRLALTEMGNSLSWKVTQPLRRIKNRLP
jgi:glycosyltransferase involved in cell wall biosynthesis